MMRGSKRIWVGLLLGLACCTAAWAMDFSAMTNQELAELRGAIQNAPDAEQNAYNLEWEKRRAAMTEEEKKLYDNPAAEEPAGEAQENKSHVQARGYESQGVGGIIYGGDSTPAQGKGSNGKK